MKRFSGDWFHSKACARVALALLLITTVFAGWLSGGQDRQSDNAPPPVCEGSLLYRSPISGRFESIPLVHTDVTLDVRGLAAAATVTQQYVNSGTDPIEAVYVFPLPHDSAVYDLEIRIGNRLIRSTIREREEAKRVYESAKSEGKRAALVEEERPNIFTTSVANLMPGDHIDVRLRYVEPLHWEDGRRAFGFSNGRRPALYSRASRPSLTLAPDGLLDTDRRRRCLSSHSARPQSRQPSWP